MRRAKEAQPALEATSVLPVFGIILVLLVLPLAPIRHVRPAARRLPAVITAIVSGRLAAHLLATNRQVELASLASGRVLPAVGRRLWVGAKEGAAGAAAAGAAGLASECTDCWYLTYVAHVHVGLPYYFIVGAFLATLPGPDYSWRCAALTSCMCDLPAAAGAQGRVRRRETETRPPPLPSSVVRPQVRLPGARRASGAGCGRHPLSLPHGLPEAAPRCVR